MNISASGLNPSAGSIKNKHASFPGELTSRGWRVTTKCPRSSAHPRRTRAPRFGTLVRKSVSRAPSTSTSSRPAASPPRMEAASEEEIHHASSRTAEIFWRFLLLLSYSGGSSTFRPSVHCAQRRALRSPLSTLRHRHPTLPSFLPASDFL